MNAAIEKITAEIDDKLEWAAWHAERGNVETAAIYRHTAAGLKRALAISLTSVASRPSTAEQPTDESTGDGRLKAERDWMAHLLVTIRDKADLRYNGNRGLLAFSDLKDEAQRQARIHPSLNLFPI